MITLTEAENALRGTVCPQCLHPALSADLILDGTSSCLCVARCGHCGARYNIESMRFENLKEILTRVEADLAQTSCPVCHQSTYQLSVRCEHPSGDCFLEARCKSCGTHYRLEDHGQHIHLIQSGD